jgi:hypothetical protein
LDQDSPPVHNLVIPAAHNLCHSEERSVEEPALRRHRRKSRFLASLEMTNVEVVRIRTRLPWSNRDLARSRIAFKLTPRFEVAICDLKSQSPEVVLG